MTEHLIHWTDATPESVGGGITKRRVNGAGSEIVRIEVPAGFAAGAHSHAHEQFVEVLHGAGTLTTSAGTRRFAAGDLFHFPPDTEHAATFEEDTELLEINVVSK